jgi:hypothetical protein
VRRQATVLLLVFNALCLGIASVAAVDLRRLATPGGTSLRWVQAAVFGDCGDFLRFSVADGTFADGRVDADRCRDLRAATQPARTASLTIGLTLAEVSQARDTATATLRLVRDGEERLVTVNLVRRDGDWRVVRDATTCASVGCG